MKPFPNYFTSLTRPVMLFALLVSLIGSAVFVTPARAATFTVTKTADTNDGTCNADCSLREAISAANASGGADTITLPAGTYQLTIVNAGGTNEDSNATGDLDILESLTIQGAGSGTTIIQAGTNNTNGIDKVIAANPFCTAGVSVTIDSVTVRYGYNTQLYGAADFSFTGGGIDWCAGGSAEVFTLTNSVISDNTNVNAYGGGLNADSLPGTSTVNITNVTFQNNRTLSVVNESNGGAINLFGDQPTIIITNSTFTGNLTTNTSSAGGAIYFRPTTVGSLTISGSTFSSNTAAGSGGAISTNTFGAGTTVSIQTSQFTGNTATNSFGGALNLDSTIDNTTPFSLSHLKITGNTAGTSGGGVYVGNSNVTMSKSLIVGNSAPTGSGIHKSVDVATATVTNNWWGCSTGPGAAPCDRATTSGGTLTFTPWYRDQLTATTSPVAVNQSTSLTASFLTNSAGSAVPVADLAEIIGRSVTWAATNGNLSGTQGTVQAAGTVTGSFQATAAGTAVISAKVDNDNTSPVSSNVLSLTVNKADTTTAITNGASLSSTDSVTGQPVAVNFSVTGAFGNSPTAPTGNVTVSDGTDSCIGTATSGTCNLTFKTAGAKTLTATFGGDSNFNASAASASASHTVNKADTTTTISSDSPDPSVTGETVTFNVTVTANAPGAAVAPTTITGTVTVSDGGTNTCIATLTAGAGSCTINFPSTGSYSMTAAYGGDSNFNGSTSAANSHTVEPADTTTTITLDDPDPSNVGQAVTVNFTVVANSPGAGTLTGNVTVSDGVDSCPGTVTVADGTCIITLTTPGARTLTATYVGDSNFNGSTSAGESHTVPIPDLTIVKSHTGDFNQGQTGAQYTITVSNAGSAPTTGTVTVVDNLPSGLTATALSGTDWSCTLGTLTCTRSDALAASSSYPNIILTMSVANNAPASVTNSATVSGGGEVNTANNTATDPTTVVADTTLPDTTIDSSPSNPSTSNSATFNFSGTDTGTGVASFECDLDGGGFSACTSPKNYSSLGDGSHTFQVRAIDGAGNVDATPASFTWTIDTTLPETIINSTPPNPSNSTSASFTFNGTDTGTGVASFECKLDAGSFAACTSPQSYSSLGEGSHTFQVRAIDGAGNADATPASFTWSIDTTPPDVTINQAAGQADPTSSSPINFTVVFSEPVSGFGDSATDVTLSGAAGATTAVVTGGPTTYNVAVSGMTSNGTVIASIPSGAAIDALGNNNNTSTSTDNAVIFTAPVPDLTISKSHTGNFNQGQTGAQYTITVSNVGTGASSGTVTVVDNLPAGLTATALTGTDWSCILGTLTCTRNDALAISSNYPNIILTVNVAGNAPSSITNNATISGGGETNTGNNTATDPTTVNPAPVAPSCNGQTATIYVNAQGRIVGGPDNGKFYRGELKGTNGADVIVGTNAKDEIEGKGGSDVICGGNGNDELEGGSGSDSLFGEAGKDELKGEVGNDTLTGGTGADKFIGGSGADTATDFNRNQGDTKSSVEMY